MDVNKIYLGDCLEIMQTFPDACIDSVITSPPYWQLRDYGWNGQWGLEKTFQEYLEHLWRFMDEVGRILKPQGTVWINLGDTYSTQSGTNTALSKGEKNWDTSATYITNRGESGKISKGKIPSKCLLLIPHRFGIGCIDRGWIVRNDIIWAKRNGMPESVTDRFTKKHEYFFFMVKSEDYYFDLDSIRDDHKTESLKRYQYDFTGNPDGLDRKQSGRPQIKATTKIPQESAELFGSPRARQHRKGEIQPQRNYENGFGNNQQQRGGTHENGKNPGDVADFWDIPTQPSNEDHYAAYNTKLIDKPIIAGCPKDGIILDPFCGTATTGLRCIELGRKFIGIDGSEKYVTKATKNLNYLLSQKTLF